MRESKGIGQADAGAIIIFRKKMARSRRPDLSFGTRRAAQQRSICHNENPVAIDEAIPENDERPRALRPAF